MSIKRKVLLARNRNGKCALRVSYCTPLTQTGKVKVENCGEYDPTCWSLGHTFVEARTMRSKTASLISAHDALKISPEHLRFDILIS